MRYPNSYGRSRVVFSIRNEDLRMWQNAGWRLVLTPCSPCGFIVQCDKDSRCISAWGGCR